MALRAGRLDRRIDLERFTLTRNQHNEPIESWVKIATVWASKDDVNDTERLRAAEIGSVITTRFVIRWSRVVKDLNPKDRLVHKGLVYNIIGIKEVGRMEGIEITASAASDLFAPLPSADPQP